LPADGGRDLSVVGVVESLPYVFAQGVRFNFRIERSLEPGVTLPPHVAAISRCLPPLSFKIHMIAVKVGSAGNVSSDKPSARANLGF
jgi:hypothetical protein